MTTETKKTLAFSDVFAIAAELDQTGVKYDFQLGEEPDRPVNGRNVQALPDIRNPRHGHFYVYLREGEELPEGYALAISTADNMSYEEMEYDRKNRVLHVEAKLSRRRRGTLRFQAIEVPLDALVARVSGERIAYDLFAKTPHVTRIDNCNVEITQLRQGSRMARLVFRVPRHVKLSNKAVDVKLSNRHDWQELRYFNPKERTFSCIGELLPSLSGTLDFRVKKIS